MNPKKLTVNRFIEDFNETIPLPNAPVDRIRYMASVMWLTKCKFKDPELSQLNTLDDVELRDLPVLRRGEWPLQSNHKKMFCVCLAWAKYPLLRKMVYDQFSLVIDGKSNTNWQPGYLSDDLKVLAATHFKQSMNIYLHKTKTEQLLHALENCIDEHVNVTRKQEMRDRLSKYRDNIPMSWQTFWGEIQTPPPPRWNFFIPQEREPVRDFSQLRRDDYGLTRPHGEPSIYDHYY